MIKLQTGKIPLSVENPAFGKGAKCVQPLQRSDSSPNEVPSPTPQIVRLSSECVVCGFHHNGGSQSWWFYWFYWNLY